MEQGIEQGGLGLARGLLRLAGWWGVSVGTERTSRAWETHVCEGVHAPLECQVLDTHISTQLGR